MNDIIEKEVFMFSVGSFFPLQSRVFVEFADLDRRVNFLDQVARPMRAGTCDSTERMRSEFESLETGEHFLLVVEMPGVSKNSLHVEVDGDCLKIAGERESLLEARDKGRAGAVRIEHVFSLPSSVDGSRIEASYQDGVLKFVMPKTEASKPRKIVIGESKDSVWLKLTRRLDHKESPTQDLVNELRHN